MEQEQPTLIEEKGHKFEIGLTASIVIALLFGGFIFYYQMSNPGVNRAGCVILEAQHCDEGDLITIDAQGTQAYGFNLPKGTPIYMPYDGVYFDESPEGETVRMRLGIVDTSTFVIIVGEHTVAEGIEYGQDVSKGQQLATLSADLAPGGNQIYNLIISAENYDLYQLFGI